MTFDSDVNLPRVSVVTSHGRQALLADPNERVIDILRRNGIPWSAVSIYVTREDQIAPALTPCLGLRLLEMEGVTDVLLYFTRNVNPFTFSLRSMRTVIEPAEAIDEPEGTEYVYQRLDNETGNAPSFLKRLTPEECRTIVGEQVRTMVQTHMAGADRMVVGVSGGGDSNALLEGLRRLGGSGPGIVPVIVKGIPEWDAGVPRAEELCADYGLDLTVVEESELQTIIGARSDDESLLERFEREFTGDDFEFLGTLLVRLALAHRAREEGVDVICTGLNLEDVVCEGLYRVASGTVPAAIPTRPIGDLSLVFPLWLCPKRIIDGCFPRYSIDNYDARFPCSSLGRNLYYSLVYGLQSDFPGMAERLARGFSEIGQRHPTDYRFDDDLGFHVGHSVPDDLRARFKRMLQGPPSSVG